MPCFQPIPRLAQSLTSSAPVSARVCRQTNQRGVLEKGFSKKANKFLEGFHYTRGFVLCQPPSVGCEHHPAPCVVPKSEQSGLGRAFKFSLPCNFSLSMRTITIYSRNVLSFAMIEPYQRGLVVISKRPTYRAWFELQAIGLPRDGSARLGKANKRLSKNRATATIPKT